ncbi:hypothetical protein ACB092_06G134300 [Castanea dentata]
MQNKLNKRELQKWKGKNKVKKKGRDKQHCHSSLPVVVIECFDLEFDGGLYGGLAIMAVAHSGANSGHGGQPPLASQNQIKPTNKKQKKKKKKMKPTKRCSLITLILSFSLVHPHPPQPLSESITPQHHLTYNPQPLQATTHNPTIIRSLSNPLPKKKKVENP